MNDGPSLSFVCLSRLVRAQDDFTVVLGDFFCRLKKGDDHFVETVKCDSLTLRTFLNGCLAGSISEQSFLSYGGSVWSNLDYDDACCSQFTLPFYFNDISIGE